MIAAHILSPEGFFLIQENGSYLPAFFNPQTNALEKTHSPTKGTNQQIWDLYQKRIQPMLVDEKGILLSFTEADINYASYIKEHQKSGYFHLPLKLLYLIYQEESDQTIEGYVIPIQGFGLWDAIYGYLAIQADDFTVIGTTWYEQAETAGLGADIALPSWQKPVQKQGDLPAPTLQEPSNLRLPTSGSKWSKARCLMCTAIPPKQGMQ